MELGLGSGSGLGLGLRKDRYVIISPPGVLSGGIILKTTLGTGCTEYTIVPASVETATKDCIRGTVSEDSATGRRVVNAKTWPDEPSATHSTLQE